MVSGSEPIARRVAPSEGIIVERRVAGLTGNYSGPADLFALITYGITYFAARPSLGARARQLALGAVAPSTRQRGLNRA